MAIVTSKVYIFCMNSRSNVIFLRGCGVLLPPRSIN